MAINAIMRATLKALSYPDVDVKTNYKLIRSVTNAAHFHILKPFYKTWDHRVPCGDHIVPVRIFVPNQDVSERYLDKSYPVILFFHGGGWVSGNINSYNKVCTNLSIAVQHVVVSVDYCLAPENPFPAGLEDCYAVAREIFLRPWLLNTKAENITIMGDSAGGNLAAAVSLLARDRGEFNISRQILLYPATNNDHNPETSEFDSIRTNATGYLLTAKKVSDYMDLYKRSKKDFFNPYFAPLLSSDLSSQPNTLMITCEFDPLRDEGEAYAQKLRSAGNHVEIHRMPDALHGFFSLPSTFSHVQKSYQFINHFLKEGYMK